MYGHLARLQGASYFPWVNIYQSRQQGVELTILWPTLKPTMDAAVEAARLGRVRVDNDATDYRELLIPKSTWGARETSQLSEGLRPSRSVQKANTLSKECQRQNH